MEGFQMQLNKKRQEVPVSNSPGTYHNQEFKSSPQNPIETQPEETKSNSNISKSTSGHKKFASRLVLVDDNPNYKRYQLVMKERQQVNIEWAGTDRITGFKPEENEVDQDLENIQEYLKKEGYDNDKFDPNSYMRQQTKKINVVREGKETQLNVYERK
jgi:hypothetical protein